MDLHTLDFCKHMCFHFKGPGTDEAVHLKPGDQAEMVVILEKQKETSV